MLLQELNLDDIFFKDGLDNTSDYFSTDDCKYLNSGKHIRARIVVSMGSALSIDESLYLKIARIIEMVHNATLVHDDVVDGSDFRRESQTLNYIYGNKSSVLFGDYILAKATFELSELEDSELLKMMSIALKRLVNGELIQLRSNSPFDITIEEYNRLAHNKTGALFSWSLTSLGRVAKKSKSLIEDLDMIGLEFGKLFQVRDDILDFSTTDKTTAMDIINNNINYIFTTYNSHFSSFEKEQILEAKNIEDLSSETYKKLMGLVKLSKGDYNDSVDSFIVGVENKLSNGLPQNEAGDLLGIFKAIALKLKI